MTDELPIQYIMFQRLPISKEPLSVVVPNLDISVMDHQSLIPALPGYEWPRRAVETFFGSPSLFHPDPA